MISCFCSWVLSVSRKWLLFLAATRCDLFHDSLSAESASHWLSGFWLKVDRFQLFSPFCFPLACWLEIFNRRSR